MSGTVLALNSNYIPIRIISKYSAIGKMYCGLASAIIIENGSYIIYDFNKWLEFSLTAKDYAFIQAVSQQIAVPKVLIYNKYDKIPKVSLKLTRKAIYTRDNYTCYLCGKDFGEHRLTLDHVIPLSRGGGNTWENLATCCKECNSKKGDKLLSELKIKPIFMPHKPATNNMQKLKASISYYDETWKFFGV
jgi:5-methylcytosine-specific restriction endonuclease McrA